MRNEPPLLLVQGQVLQHLGILLRRTTHLLRWHCTIPLLRKVRVFHYGARGFMLRALPTCLCMAWRPPLSFVLPRVSKEVRLEPP